MDQRTKRFVSSKIRPFWTRPTSHGTSIPATARLRRPLQLIDALGRGHTVPTEPIQTAKRNLREIVIFTNLGKNSEIILRE